MKITEDTEGTEKKSMRAKGARMTFSVPSVSSVFQSSFLTVSPPSCHFALRT
jgi:hypothetical protein